MNEKVNEKKNIIKLTHSSSYGIEVWYRERNDNVYCSGIALVESRCRRNYNGEEEKREKMKQK